MVQGTDVVRCRLRALSRSILLCVALGLVAAAPASAGTLYMSPSGSGSLCSLASPCGSMNAAYQAAMPGDTVAMANGTYGSQNISPRSLPGTNSIAPSGDEITFKPQVSGGSVTVQGMILGGVRSAPVEHIAFEDMTFTDWTATRSGEDVHFTRTKHRAQLHANWVRYLSYQDGEVGPFVDDTGDGLQFNQIDGQAGHHILIEGMAIHDIHPNNTAAHPDAIQWFGPYNDVTMRGNRLYNNDNINMRADGEMQRHVVENNFFGAAKNPVVSRFYTAQIQGNGNIIRYNSFVGAIQPAGDWERSGQVWEGNIVTWSTCDVTGSDSTVRYNVWVGGVSCGTNSKSVSNPGFVDQANGDLHLRSDSPAIGAGHPSSFPSTDVDKQARPANGTADAGADEVNGTAPPPPPPPPPADSQAPSTPSGVSATGGRGQAQVSWSASTDNVGVDHYNLHRGTTSSFAPGNGNRVAQPTGTSYTDANLPAGTYWYKVTAEDAAGNVSGASAGAQATVTSDTVPPTVSLTAPANGSTVSGTVSVTANSSDDTSVVGVQFKLDGNNLGAEDTSAPYQRNWSTTAVANGPHTLTAVARDPAGNTATSTPVQVTVNNVDPNPVGLVAAYGFEETSGANANDSSGLDNTGTVSGASRVAGGRFGRALSFDGVNDLVNVLDDGSLDLTNAATISAWVRPSAISDWRTVVMKERPGGLVYGLYANTDSDRPAASISTDAYRDARGGSQLPANAWRHLAMTYDGATLRLYVNGVQAGTSAVAGALPPTDGPLTIGGNGVWGEWFQGLIDEVRVYRDVLNQSEIQTDMAAPVVGGTQPADTQAPSVSVTSPSGGSTVSGTVELRANASDDRGVSGVQFRVDGANVGAQDTSSPYRVNWDTTDVSDGQHTITAVARDAAGNATTSQPVSVTVKNALLPPLPDPPPLPLPDPPLTGGGKTGTNNGGKGGKGGKITRGRTDRDGTSTIGTAGLVRITKMRATKLVCRTPRAGCAGKLRVRFRLSRAARVLVVLERVGPGATGGRTKLLRRKGRRGLNRVRLPGRVLQRGRYRITVTTVDTGVRRPARARTRVG